MKRLLGFSVLTVLLAPLPAEACRIRSPNTVYVAFRDVDTAVIAHVVSAEDAPVAEIQIDEVIYGRVEPGAVTLVRGQPPGPDGSIAVSSCGYVPWVGRGEQVFVRLGVLESGGRAVAEWSLLQDARRDRPLLARYLAEPSRSERQRLAARMRRSSGPGTFLQFTP